MSEVRANPPLFREILLVASGVGIVEVSAYFAGLHRWTSFAFRQWPDLLQRFSLLFPVFLGLAILIVRRWHLPRQKLVVAALLGASVGILAAITSLLLAQAWTPDDRSQLATTISEFYFEFTLIQIIFAVAGTLGWLRGALSGVLCIALDRLLKNQRD